jgi:hypothetical protein
MLDSDTSLTYKWQMQGVVETKEYLRRPRQCGISDQEREEIIDFIAENPLAGDEIPGTGGARKVRFARPGKGKSGGYRIITFFSGQSIPVFLLTVFAKNEQANISQADKNTLRRALGAMVETYKKDQEKKR